ncbi:MAG: mandelate racemase/muconate lactonizing enzyme family protein [Candidatus Bathyarchaeia archaeon]
MKITSLVTVPITCHGKAKRGIVRVTSDEGVSGYGEIGEAATGNLGKTMSESWRRFIVGKNPMDIERILREIWVSSRFFQPMGGVVGSALSGLDFALVDLKGKLLGIPGYQVVGGAYRTAVRVYQDTAGGPDVETFRRNALDAVERGFDAVKFDLDSGFGEQRAQAGYDPFNETVTETELNQMVEIAAAIREAIGFKVDLAFDLHMRYNTQSGIKIAKALEPYRLMWLEEPVPPENVDALREVKAATSTPICAGENLYAKWGFKDLLEKQAVSIVMPDVAKVGGILESKRIADLADMYYVPMAPHNNCGPLATIAMAHLCASIPNFLVLEWHGTRMKDWDAVVKWDGPVVNKGRILLPEKPGLGYELNEKEILRRDPEAEELFR